MTSKPLTFQFQHLCWQQRLQLEKKKAEEFKLGDQKYKTNHDNLPKYLETIDKKRILDFRSSHPKRFLPPPSTVSGQSAISVKSRRSQTGQRHSAKAHDLLSTTSKKSSVVHRRERSWLQNSGFPDVAKLKATANMGVDEILEQNEKYENAVQQISKRIALREAMERASDVLSQSNYKSQVGDEVSRTIDGSQRGSIFSARGRQQPRELSPNVETDSRFRTTNFSATMQQLPRRDSQNGADRDQFLSQDRGERYSKASGISRRSSQRNKQYSQAGSKVDSRAREEVESQYSGSQRTHPSLIMTHNASQRSEYGNAIDKHAKGAFNSQASSIIKQLQSQLGRERQEGDRLQKKLRTLGNHNKPKKYGEEPILETSER